MISISIPSDNPEVREILEEIVQVAGELSSSACVPLEEAETRVRDLRLRSGQKLLEVYHRQLLNNQQKRLIVLIVNRCLVRPRNVA